MNELVLGIDVAALTELVASELVERRASPQRSAASSLATGDD